MGLTTVVETLFFTLIMIKSGPAMPITCSDGSLSTVVRSMTSSDGQTHFSMSGHTGTADRIAIKNGRGDYVTHMTPQTNFHDNPPRGLFPANT